MPQTERMKIRVEGSAFGDMELDCKVEGDYLVYDDMIICTEREARQKGLVVRAEKRRWPNGVVPYAVHEDLLTHNGKVPSRISDAIAEIQFKTNVRFVERTDEHDFVEYVHVPFNRCRASVGRQGGRQEIILGPQCGPPQVLHETLHALGLEHEHTRPDRDQFVEVLKDNILHDERGNYAVRSGTEPIGPYDYNSRMHYEEDAFSANGQLTMRSKTDRRIDPVQGMSPGDVATVNAIYPEVPEEPVVEEPVVEEPVIEVEPDLPELRFQGGRFKVTVESTTEDGRKHQGLALPGAADASGLFYFFDRGNWEILCKVLDGGGDHFWVYAAAATSEEWELRVEDTATGAVKTYRHTGGAAVEDTRAFAKG